MGPDTLVFDDTGLDPGTVYTYVVEAFDGTGAATASNVLELTTASSPPLE